MDEPFQELSEQDIIKAIEDNEVELFSLYGRWPKAETYLGSGLFWTITEIPMAYFNNVLRARMPAEDVGKAIEEVIYLGRSKRVPVSWKVTPATQPANLGELLTASGFKRHVMPGMAVELAALDDKITRPGNFRIVRLGEDGDLEKWFHVLAVGFSVPDPAAGGIRELMETTWRYGLSEGSFYNYVGLWDGEAAAVSSLFLGAGVAGIYNVATLPGARRQGFGSMMTHYPLLEARKMGYRAGILQSSEMGLNVYKRLGFKEYYRISDYVWKE